ncbi:MAG: hypothetical protein WCO98_08280 [bacterium]
MSVLTYPLSIKFKVWALTNQFSITGADGSMVAYIKQKAFKLKDDVQVFSDEKMNHQIFSIKADRVIDFSARFTIKNDSDQEMGSIKRDGMKSLWRIHYNVTSENNTNYTIQEHNPWIRFLDSVLAELPLIGILSAYVLQPVYDVKTADGTVVMNMKKMPSLLGRYFTINRPVDIDDREEELIMLSLMMVVLLERAKG